MAVAKLSPTIFRLRKSQRLNRLGNTAWSEDAANATYINGTEQRTENWIIAETFSARDRSTPLIAITTAMDIGTVISQYRFQPLMILCCRNSLGFTLKISCSC